MKLRSWASWIGLACVMVILKACTFATYARILVDVSQFGTAATEERVRVAASRSGLRSTGSGRIGERGARYLKFVEPSFPENKELSLTVVFSSERELEGTFAQLNVHDFGENAIGTYRTLVRELTAEFGRDSVRADVANSRGQKLLL